MTPIEMFVISMTVFWIGWGFGYWSRSRVKSPFKTHYEKTTYPVEQWGEPGCPYDEHGFPIDKK